MTAYLLSRFGIRAMKATAIGLTVLAVAGCGGNGGDGSLASTSKSVVETGWNDSSNASVINMSVSSGGRSSTTPSAYVSATPPVNAADDFVTIREAQGVSTIDYPVQIGRVFLRGEITNFPQALVDGQGVTTQADVKTRWPDGSAKYTIMSFYLPTLEARQTRRITFTNQLATPTDGLTNAQMLDPTFNFDSVLRISNGGQSVAASARDMLSKGYVTRWISGPVSTSIILADHSTARTFDLGFDSYRSLRPIFHVTFWPRINKVFVRVIGETSNPDAWQTMSYDLNVTGGASNPAIIYSRSAVNHHPAARWTRTFWIGEVPGTVDINHNIRYLAASGSIPNYDSSITVAQTAIQSLKAAWDSADKGILDRGNWQKGMGTAGGRPDIGPFPNWVVAWLYSGDHRAADAALGNADLAGAWPMHLRESKAGRIYDPVTNAPALGRPISVFARPTFVMSQGNVNIRHEIIKPEDAIQFIGSEAGYNGWGPDAAHQPDPFSIAYLLTGEYWYLEEMQFWASWGTFLAVPGGANWSRGPLNTSGGIHNEDRGEAWAFRTRVQAAWYSPDGSPERAYLERQTADAIAIWEGKKGVTGTTFYGSREWQWGRAASAEDETAYGSSTLGFWIPGITSYANAPEYQPGTVKLAIATWTNGFVIAALGRGKELGYPTEGLLKWMAPFYTRIAESGTNLMAYTGLYTIPSVSAVTGKYFQSWADITRTYVSGYDALSVFRDKLQDLDHGYALIACAAASYVASEPGGASAIDFCDHERIGRTDFSQNPKWAIRPR